MNKDNYRELLSMALERTGERVEDLLFVVQDGKSVYLETNAESLPVKSAYALGTPIIAYSRKFIYVRENYDGFTDIEIVPRNPEVVKEVKKVPYVGTEEYIPYEKNDD